MDAVAIVLAAGASERMGGGGPKAFLEIGGRTLLEHAAAAAAGCTAVEEIVVTVPPGSQERARALLAELPKPVEVISGGDTRQASVRLALQVLPPGASRVLCHDAARPLASPALFVAVLGALEAADGAVPAVPVTDTVKRVRDGAVVATEPRDALWLAQTPQAFHAAALRDAHSRASEEGFEGTDDAALLERAGYRVVIVDGDPGNLKVTTLEDLERAEAALAGSLGG